MRNLPAKFLFLYHPCFLVYYLEKFDPPQNNINVVCAFVIYFHGLYGTADLSNKERTFIRVYVYTRCLSTDPTKVEAFYAHLGLNL